ncbi:MAG TPA: cytochrome P450 [Nitrososphaerales archaeon]|nr:cytochrome P450 [Nitrososphaerales archaeon]
MESEVKIKTKAIPSVSIVPVGSFLLRNLANIHKKYQDIVQLKLGVTKLYLVTNPELIQEILVTKQRDFVKGEYLQRTKKVFGEGLLTSEGDFHHRQRRLVQPAFHQSRIESYASTMTSYTERMIGSWHDGQTLDIHKEMMKLTMSIVAKCLFDTDVESESETIARDLTTTIEYFGRLSSPISPLLQKLPSNRKYEEAIKRIDAMVYGLIEGRRKLGKDTGDLMSMLLHAKDEAGVEMTDRQLRDEVLILFAAGHETTANALTWTWYLLSENEAVEAKMHEEVDSVIPDGSLPTAHDLAKLDYTTKVLTESMRIYPPAWILVRKALRDCAIGDYILPQDANVVISQYVNHHDPKYFPDPESFIPERWTQDMRKRLPKFAYFPFGGGPRGCVGEPFAWMEGVLLLATISKRWRMNHIESHKVEMLPRITLRPKYGMKMRLEDRAK